MEKGDLFFKAVESHYDSWRTVKEYEVYHYFNKERLIAKVKKVSRDIKDTKHKVFIDGIEWNCVSMEAVLNCIVDYYDRVKR